MSESKKRIPITTSRRAFLAGSAAVAGAAAVAGMPREAKAKPKRGGTLRFATRSDSAGLDPHRNIIYYSSHPLAATSQGLLDLDTGLNPSPGIAQEWSISDDLMTYTFKMRKGVTYHNGRDVDAESIKWNYSRILDPKIGHSFVRSGLLNIKEMVVVDKGTIRFHLKTPSAVFASNVVYYPCGLMAPDSVDQADTHPITAGPFKFKSWTRYQKTELLRYENYFETDEAGNALPYFDGIIGTPKKEDRVRLTALRTGEADLIENMAYADAGDFKKKYSEQFGTFDIPQVGQGYAAFNLKTGPFSYKNPDGHQMRMAVAHAVDRQALHEAVFYGLGSVNKGFYGPGSPWEMPGIKGYPEYDPEKSKFILRKLNALNTPLTVTARQAYSYMRQTGEVLHAMMLEVGFKATNEVHPNPVLRQKYKKGEYSLDSTASSYRPDPDGWFSRQILSTGASTKLRTGYNSPAADKLIIEARATKDRNKRMELYTAVEDIVNADLPLLYTHTIPLLSAFTKRLKDYKPAFAGPFNVKGGGIRKAYFG